MNITWMTHPEHGRMPVYHPWHVKQNQENGWKVETDEQKRRGRPPKADAQPADDDAEG